MRLLESNKNFYNRCRRDRGGECLGSVYIEIQTTSFPPPFGTTQHSMRAPTIILV